MYERPVQDVPQVKEQCEMIASKPQDKYQLYLTPQSTGGHQLVIGSMMHHDDSALVTHQALACMMPAFASQPWLAASSFMTYQPLDTLPCFSLLSSHTGRR